MAKKHISDWLEQLIADALDGQSIEYTHGSQGKHRLDFHLPKQDVYIEVKQFHSDRIAAQTALEDNVIVLQGVKSVKLFVELLSSKP